MLENATVTVYPEVTDKKTENKHLIWAKKQPIALSIKMLAMAKIENLVEV
jgi:hypothetical protein